MDGMVHQEPNLVLTFSLHVYLCISASVGDTHTHTHTHMLGDIIWLIISFITTHIHHLVLTKLSQSNVVMIKQSVSTRLFCCMLFLADRYRYKQTEKWCMRYGVHTEWTSCKVLTVWIKMKIIWFSPLFSNSQEALAYILLQIINISCYCKVLLLSYLFVSATLYSISNLLPVYYLSVFYNLSLSQYVSFY